MLSPLTINSAEEFCFKNDTYFASESDRNTSFVVIRSGAANDRSCIGYNITDDSTRGIYLSIRSFMSSLLAYSSIARNCLFTIHLNRRFSFAMDSSIIHVYI